MHKLLFFLKTKLNLIPNIIKNILTDHIQNVSRNTTESKSFHLKSWIDTPIRVK